MCQTPPLPLQAGCSAFLEPLAAEVRAAGALAASLQQQASLSPDGPYGVFVSFRTAEAEHEARWAPRRVVAWPPGSPQVGSRPHDRHLAGME